MTRGASEVPKLPSTVMERIASGSLTVEAAWTELAEYSRIVQRFEAEAACDLSLGKRHSAGRLLGMAMSIERDVEQVMESLRALKGGGGD